MTAQPKPSDDFDARVTTFGDWGNIHFEAYTGPRQYWELHLQFCARCRAVDERLKREREAKTKDQKRARRSQSA